VDVGTEENPTIYNYVLKFTRFPKEKIVTVQQETITRNGETILNNSRDKLTEDPYLFTQTYIEQVSRNSDFRDLVNFFQSCRYLHVVPQVVRDPRRALEKEEDFYGGDLLKRIAETQKKVREPRLRRIGEALKLAVPQFDGLSLQQDTLGHPHLVVRFLHWREHPSEQNETVFSDGTLRLIGFLWSIAEKEGPLLLEEPELSLHEEVVKQLPAMIAKMQRRSGRQVIMSTHSAAMIGPDSGVTPHEVMILTPSSNGTTLKTADQDDEMVVQFRAGISMAEITRPITMPQKVNQLSLLDILG
jgi:predicted ATPase